MFLDKRFSLFFERKEVFFYLCTGWGVLRLNRFTGWRSESASVILSILIRLLSNLYEISQSTGKSKQIDLNGHMFVDVVQEHYHKNCKIWR